MESGDIMIELTQIRHTYPENAGFCIERRHGRADYTFIHFYNSVEITIDGREIQTQPHAVILYAPGVPQKYRSPEPLLHDWFHFDGSLADLSFAVLRPNKIFYPGEFSQITKTVAEMEHEFFGSRKNRAALLELLLRELLIRIDRSLEATDPNPGSVRSDIEQRFRAYRGELFSSLDVRRTVADMAREMNLSQSRFFALYKAIFGISPTADLINARINSAKNLLLFQDRRIEDIAVLLGYENVTHFIRQFKTAVGVTPTSYRKNNR